MERQWPHAPLHRLDRRGAYIVTAGTYDRELYFNAPEKLDILLAALFDAAELRGWKLQAWALLANHYHFVAVSPDGPETLREFVAEVHRTTAAKINALDGSPGRKVWHQYWDSKITYQKSYFARLKYVHNNPVRHGLVRKAEEYKWCSAAWFQEAASPALQKTVLSFPIDRVNVVDDY